MMEVQISNAGLFLLLLTLFNYLNYADCYINYNCYSKHTDTQSNCQVPIFDMFFFDDTVNLTTPTKVVDVMHSIELFNYCDPQAFNATGMKKILLLHNITFQEVSTAEGAVTIYSEPWGAYYSRYSKYHCGGRQPYTVFNYFRPEIFSMLLQKAGIS